LDCGRNNQDSQRHRRVRSRSLTSRLVQAPRTATLVGLVFPKVHTRGIVDGVPSRVDSSGLFRHGSLDRRWCRGALDAVSRFGVRSRDLPRCLATISTQERCQHEDASFFMPLSTEHLASGRGVVRAVTVHLIARWLNWQWLAPSHPRTFTHRLSIRVRYAYW